MKLTLSIRTSTSAVPVVFVATRSAKDSAYVPATVTLRLGSRAMPADDGAEIGNDAENRFEPFVRERSSVAVTLTEVTANRSNRTRAWSALGSVTFGFAKFWRIVALSSNRVRVYRERASTFACLFVPVTPLNWTSTEKTRSNSAA